jgi:hypothetical protein
MLNRKPAFRKLRGYAFDPSLSLSAKTVDINSIVYKVLWEDLKETEDDEVKKKNDPQYEVQRMGPVGEYVEVIDYDPSVDKFYKPVDLNDPYILAQDGLDPSEGNPQFHQQMVYAVAMTTIKNFEKALGRKVLWASRKLQDATKYEEYVHRLRIYPHALREANAYYSPQKKALLFGYFSSSPADISLQMPGSLVFTCLSHDIIAHETTHAILDGMHREYNTATNPDVLAFHEAFADIVALFQHFTFPDVLKNQIAETHGDLGAQNLLGKLAQEFGTAIGSYGSLRDAIGKTDEKSDQWTATRPNPADYRTVMEPHARGSILVAAVFEAFINIYKSRVADLLRIATTGVGILPSQLQPDLVNRLANEAAKSARHVLSMCIRAIDYCPPVDITFGDYLRAIITADIDLVSDDAKGYRLHFIDAFRRRGIYPKHIKTLSVESLRYTLEPFVSQQTKNLFLVITGFLRDYRTSVMYLTDRKQIYDFSREYMGGTNIPSALSLHKRIFIKFEESAEFEKLTGLVFDRDWAQLGIRTSHSYQGNVDGGVIGPSFQVQNLRCVSRVGPDGNQINQITFSLTQRAGVKTDNGEFKGYYIPEESTTPSGGFELWGGCTMIFDLDTLSLRYAISRPLLNTDSLKGVREIDKTRAENQYKYQNEDGNMALGEYSQYFGLGVSTNMDEPFALLHHP